METTLLKPFSSYYSIYYLVSVYKSNIEFRNFLPSKATIRRHGLNLCARIVLFSYVVLMFQPVIPIVMDNMAHAFWVKSHYQLVHKHGGKEHVHHELKKIAKDDLSGKVGMKCKSQKEAQPHIPVASMPAISATHSSQQLKYGDYVCHFTSAFSAVDYPPPRA